MKVVLFCGGYGMRMRDSKGEGLPKPMQMVGPRPLIWHVMWYHAHFGHKEFDPMPGHGASHVKNYFLTYQESGLERFCDGRWLNFWSRTPLPTSVTGRSRLSTLVSNRPSETNFAVYARISKMMSTFWPIMRMC